MRISLIYPGATWSVYDVARGYERALRALGHEVSVFDYHNQGQFYAQYFRWLQAEHGIEVPNDAAMVFASERVLVEVVDVAPDVVLIVTGIRLHRRAYELVHRVGAPMALILTESPYMDDLQALILEKGHLGLAFTNDRASVDRLADSGVPVRYLPHSFDPERHHPQPVGPAYQTDIFFHGTLWPERQELFQALDLAAYRAQISGTRIDGTRNEVVGSIIDNDEMALWYNGARMVLNPHRTVRAQGGDIAPGEAWSLGPRAFEVAACGAFQMCDDSRPELGGIFGESVATYRDAADLQRQIAYFLGPGESERLARARDAMERVQQCTFEDRAREILIPALEEVA